MRLDECDISARTRNVLLRAGIETVEQLKELSQSDLVRLRGAGNRALREISDLLDKQCPNRRQLPAGWNAPPPASWPEQGLIVETLIETKRNGMPWRYRQDAMWKHARWVTIAGRPVTENVIGWKPLT